MATEHRGAIELNKCKLKMINEGAMTVPLICHECGAGKCKYGVEPVPRHVDEFIDDMDSDPYASWFFSLARFPAILKGKVREWTDQYKLFCDYEGKRHRVTGCSRLGDVWLTRDFKQSNGYQKRINVDDCSNWSSSP